MKYLPIIISIILVSACTRTKQPQDPSVLVVDINKTSDDFYELFDSVKLTPLETSDQSLIGRVDKIYDLDSLWIIQDNKLQIPKAFDKKGKFLHQYGAVGGGPGEYPFVYGMGIDRSRQEVIILPPWGNAHKFTVSGEFISSVELPAAPSYGKIFRLNDDRWVIWSPPIDKESIAIQVVDNDFNLVYTGQPFDNVYADLNFFDTNFSTDKGKLYVQGQFSRQVYEIGSDSISKAYIWDFGDYNVKDEAYRAYSDEPEPDPNTYFEKQKKLLSDENLRWRISLPANNRKYRHIQYRKSQKMSDDGRHEIEPAYNLHIFYDKQTGESIVVNNFSQIPFRGSPFLMDDEKVTLIIKNEDIDAFRNFAVNGDILEGFDADESNPVIATFYLKNYSKE